MHFEFFAEPDPSLELCTKVAALEPTNPFYMPNYIEFKRALGFQPWVFALRQDGRIVSGCTSFAKSGRLNRSLEITSLPILPDSNKFWEGLLQFCREARISQLEINSFASSSTTIPRLPGEIRRRVRCEYVLELEKPGLWDRLSSNHMRNNKNARKAGLRVRRAVDHEACQQHIGLIRESMLRRRNRGESVPEDFETLNLLAMIQSEAGQLFQAVLDGKVLSSVLILMAQKGGYYHSAGTSSEGMACGASHFLVHEIGNTLQAEGKQVFNLGGVDQDNPGLERFKAGFGASPVRLESAELFLGSKVRNKLGTITRLLTVGRKD